MADPGWRYKDALRMETTKRSSMDQYKTTMTVDQICALYTPSSVENERPLALGGRRQSRQTVIPGRLFNQFELADTGFLWLWCTPSTLLDGSAAAVCNAWGYAPKQIGVWIKAQPDPGPEHWRACAYPDHYEVSTHGRVRRNGKILAQQAMDPDGYPRVRLYKDGVPWDARVHRLVGETFLGPRPADWQTDHIDGTKTNNCLVNLEYVPPIENVRRAIELGNQGGGPSNVPEEFLSQTRKAIQSRRFRAKLQMGMGHLLRNTAEFFIIGTRGKYTLLKKSSSQVNTIIAPEDALIVAPRREHSRKPDEIYDKIESVCPGPYLELFARSGRAGWTSYGDELESEAVAESVSTPSPARPPLVAHTLFIVDDGEVTEQQNVIADPGLEGQWPE